MGVARQRRLVPAVRPRAYLCIMLAGGARFAFPAQVQETFPLLKPSC